MKPPSFSYFAPETVSEAVSLLKEHGEDAKILAGGQSLVPLLNFRLARPSVLIDINRIQSLNYVRFENGQLAIGATTRQHTIETSDEIKRQIPLLSEATQWIGHPQIRHRGTVCGSLAHADPASEYPATFLALGGEALIQGPAGERRVSLGEFFVDYLTNCLEPNEMLVEVRAQVPPPKAGMAFVEFARRHGDYAIVGVAALVALDAQGICNQVGLTLSGVGATPIKAHKAEAILLGEKPTPDVLQRAAKQAADETDPETTLHGTAEYRRHLAEVLSLKALSTALSRVRG